MENLLIIEGKNSVLESLKANYPINKIFLDKNHFAKFQEIIRLAKTKNIIIQLIDKKQLNTISSSHQGVIAFVSPYQYADLDAIFKKAKTEPLFTILLDKIEDPRNLGAILRTADATGVHGIIIPKKRSVLITSTVIKTSAGAAFHFPICKVTNIVETIKLLKKQGVWIIGLDSSGKNIYSTINMTLPIGLVIGSEGKGISRLVKEHCDFIINIPMKGKITSLNVSVASAIVMYEVYRQRSFIKTS